MAYTYKQIEDEVKRRSTRDQGGPQYDTAIKNIINTSLFRLAREALWRPLRRKTTFDTISTYTTGSGGGTFTNGSKAITMVGATFITDNIKIGQRINIQGSSKDFVIKTITGETTLTVDINYSGTTISGTGTYSILAQEEYNLPIQASHRMFLWHEEYGHPVQLQYITEQDFIESSAFNTTESIPVGYRMWGNDSVIDQVLEGSVVTLSSSVSTDTNISVTIFGIVADFPDFEVITTNASNGTTAVVGLKTFASIERVVKSSSSTGRITVTANSANTTLAVLPVGDTTSGIKYSKVQLWPLPNAVFPINVQYYKDPYRLVNDGDVHELGQDFDEALILLATAKIDFQSSKDEASNYFILYKDELMSLKKTNVDKIDWFPTLRGQRSGGGNSVHPFLQYQQAGAHYGRSSRY